MSLARQAAVAGQTATAFFEEDSVMNLRTGKPFTAKVSPVQDIELNVSIGRDARESVIFYVKDPLQAAEINVLDKVKVLGSIFQILRISNNPASLHAEFGAMNLVKGYDY